MTYYDYEENQHDENCNWIYGNCDCIMSDPDISEDDRIRMLIDKYDDRISSAKSIYTPLNGGTPI